MILNHINLPVGDVGATRDFFAQFFGMRTLLELPRNSMAMMRDEGGMVLIISHFDKDKTAAIPYHADFHVGFFVDSRAEVDAKYAELSAAGWSLAAPKRLQGRYGIYVAAPGGFEVEVACLEQTTRLPGRPLPDEQADEAVVDRR